MRKKQKSISLLLLISVFTFALGLQSQPANAAWPGQNGKLVYSTASMSGETPVSSLYSNTLSGSSEQTMIEYTADSYLAPRFSADGEKVTYTALRDFDGGGGDIYVASADGTGQQKVTDIVQGDFPDRVAYGAFYSSFNNDASRVAYGEYWGEGVEEFCYIFTVATNGGGKQQLTNDPNYCDLYPVFSPDGSKVAFIRLNKQTNQVAIYTVDANGANISHIHTLAEPSYDILGLNFLLMMTPHPDASVGSTIDWSPSGDAIVFTDTAIEHITETELRAKASIKRTSLLGAVSVVHEVEEHISDNNDMGTYPDELKSFLNPQYTPEGQIVFREFGFDYVSNGLTVRLSMIDEEGSNYQNIKTSTTYDLADGAANIAMLEFLLPTVQPVAAESGAVILKNPENGKDIILSQTACGQFASTSALAESTHAVQDGRYSYPSSFVNFTLAGCEVGGETTITAVFAGLSGEPSDYVARKYNPNAEGDKYFDIPGATITSATHGGQPAVQLVYTITDGGPLDLDGQANGVIVDPVGLGVLASAEDQLLAETGRSVIMLQLVSVAVILAGGSYLLRRVYA